MWCQYFIPYAVYIDNGNVVLFEQYGSSKMSNHCLFLELTISIGLMIRLARSFLCLALSLAACAISASVKLIDQKQHRH